MPTIQQIEADLIADAQAGDLVDFTKTVNSVTASQKSSLDSGVLGQALDAVIGTDAANPSGTDAAVKDFMNHLGAYTDVPSIGDAMITLAQEGDLAGLKVIIDNVDAAQKPLLDPGLLGNTLEGITQSEFSNPSGTDAAIQDFMTHLGAYTDVGVLGGAMAFLAEQAEDLAGLKVIVDNIDAAQKPLLDPSLLGGTLSGITESEFSNPAGTDAAIQDFMTHLGAYTDAGALGPVMTFLAQAEDLVGLKAIVDNITTAQKSLLDSTQLGLTLDGIIESDSSNPLGTDAAIQDFMNHLGAYTDVEALGGTMNFLAQQAEDLAGLKAIVDNIADAQKPLLDPGLLGGTLEGITESEFSNPTGTDAAIQDFMNHLGAYTDAGAIGQVMAFLAQQAEDLPGLKAVVDNISDAQKPLLDPGLLDTTLEGITLSEFSNPSATDAAIQDFMSHLGAETDVGVIGQVMGFLLQNGDLTGLKAIVDNVADAQKPLLDPIMLGGTLEGITHSEFSNPAGIDAAIQDFMSHLGAYTDVGAIGQVMNSLAESGDLAGLKAVVDNIDVAQKPLLDPSGLGNTLDSLFFSSDFSNPSGTDAAIKDFMTHLGAYTDVGSLGLPMNFLAQQGDFVGLKAIVDNIDAAQKPLIDPFELGNTLGMLIGSDFVNPSGTDAAIQDFMTHLGAYTAAGSFSMPMEFLAQNGDLAGVKAIVDNIDAAQKPLIDPFELGNTLGMLIGSDFVNPSGTDAAIQDFMTHLGAYTAAGSFSMPMEFLAQNGDLAGVKAIVDNIDAAQKPLIDPFELGNTLGMLIGSDFVNPSGTDAAIQDFMTHLGAYTAVGSMDMAMDFLAQNGDLAGVKAIVDNIDAAQKPLFEPFELGNTLGAILGSDSANPSGTDAAIQDFMTHLGAYTDVGSMDMAMDFLAQNGDLAGVKAIVDNIDAAQKPLFEPFELGNTLGMLIGSDSANPSGTDAAIQDFMTHLGAYTDVGSMDMAMDFLAQNGDLAGVKAIVDNIDAAQKPLFDPFELGNTLFDIISNDTVNPSGTDAAIKDFMTHLGAYTDAEGMVFAMNILAQQGDLTGVKVIVDNIDAAQKSMLDPIYLGNALDALVGDDAGNPSGTAAAAADFMAKLGAYTAGPSIESAVMTVGNNGDWQTSAEILGHLNAAQDSGLSAGFQGWMASNDVQLTATSGVTLTGIAGASNTLVAHGANDTLNGDGLNDVLYGFGHGDVLNGGAGAEILIGHGLATLNGGTGSNDFVLDGGGQTGVNNFTLSQNDVLDLRDVLAPTDDLTAHLSQFLQLVDTAAGTEVLVNRSGNPAHPWVDIGLVTNFHDTDAATLIATHHLVA